MSRFNTVQHGSSRISKVVHGAATVVTRFIPDHQTGVNRHLKPGQWERGLTNSSALAMLFLKLSHQILEYWLSFVVSNCEFVTFPLVSWVNCGTYLYRFLIFAPLLTSICCKKIFYCIVMDDMVTQQKRRLRNITQSHSNAIQSYNTIPCIASVCLPVPKKALNQYQLVLKIWSSKVRKTAKIRNQYNQVPNLTQETTWGSDKNTIRHHKQKPRGQPVPSSWPQAAMKRRESMTNTRHK